MKAFNNRGNQLVLLAAFLVGLLAWFGPEPVAADCGVGSTPGVGNCTVHFFEQQIDHFSWTTAVGTYQQRYFVYDQWYRPGGPILFYNGNEADVELYVNCTGLMWENGEALGAALVFAEHRYFGQSLPCPGGFAVCGDYLTTEQAMADYALLIAHLRAERFPATSGVVVEKKYL